MPLPAANFYFILRNGFDKLSLNSFFFLSDPLCPAVREMPDSIPSLLSLFHIEELKKDFITSNISNHKCFTVEECALPFCVRPQRCPCCCHCRAPACPRASPFLRPLAARPASPCPCYCAKLRAVAICPARTPGYLANLLEKTDSLILMSYCSLYQCSVISRNILLIFTYLLTYVLTTSEIIFVYNLNPLFTNLFLFPVAQRVRMEHSLVICLGRNFTRTVQCKGMFFLPQ